MCDKTTYLVFNDQEHISADITDDEVFNHGRVNIPSTWRGEATVECVKSITDIQDDVDNAIFDFITTHCVPGDDTTDLDDRWDIAMISEVREAISGAISEYGYKLPYPAIETSEDGERVLYVYEE